MRGFYTTKLQWTGSR